MTHMFFQDLAHNGLDNDEQIPNMEYLRQKLEANFELYKESVEKFEKLTTIIGSQNMGNVKSAIKNDIEGYMHKISAEKK